MFQHSTSACPKKARRRPRTFTGCWTCRKRKVRCDQGKPCCSACQRLGLVCTGYGPKLVWADEDSNLPYKSDGRRSLSCESTWGNTQVLDSELVDFLIARCDEEDVDTGRGIQLALQTLATNPFSAFKLNPVRNVREDKDGTTETSLSLVQLLYNRDQAATERHLFHHYVNHLAFIMMPFEHPRNPWKSSYPAVALQHSSLGQRALYNAILAHSAFHLSQLSADKRHMTMVAVKHYNLAIPFLTESLGCQDAHYAEMLAAISTLMLAETYSGQSRRWKHHLKGAWSLLNQSQTSRPWLESDFACISTQSLYIIRVIDGTAKTCSDIVGKKMGDLPPSEASLLTSIGSTLGFGFTIGATRTVIECISKITLAASKTNKVDRVDKENRDDPEIVLQDASLMNILAELHDCEAQLEDGFMDNLSEPPVQRSDAYHQLKAFVHAAHIYLYRAVFDLPPQSLKSHISEALRHVSAFSASHRGNFSLWPAFIAAVEAYDPEDMVLAQAWLEYALSFGLGSRRMVQKVLEEVWKRRKDIATSSHMDPGIVSVDWREVMRDFEVDVLLV